MHGGTFDRVVAALVAAVRDVYGDRLDGVVLFGSVATRTARSYSDVDVLVVAHPLPDGRLDRMDEFAAVDAAIAPTLDAARRGGVDTRISPIVRTPDELSRTGYVLFDIASDGDVRFDRSGQVAHHLEGVRRRLRERGAERRAHPAGPYWVIEPDVRPGQVVEL